MLSSCSAEPRYRLFNRRDDSRDMEIRTRAMALLRKIEGSLLTQPTLVTLDLDDAPIAKVVQALSERSGMKITLFPQNLPRWKLDRVSLRETEPLPFWKAIDRFCATTGLQYDLEVRGFSTRGEPTLTFADRGSRVVYPVSDHGPFRVNLIGLEYQRNVGFALVPPPARRPFGGGRAAQGVAHDQAQPRDQRPVLGSASGDGRAPAGPQPDRALPDPRGSRRAGQLAGSGEPAPGGFRDAEELRLHGGNLQLGLAPPRTTEPAGRSRPDNQDSPW